MSAQEPLEITRQLQTALQDVEFSAPVAYVYDPLEYAWEPHAQYFRRFGHQRPRQVLLVGMNPGPWGMGQVGVPFGAVEMVRDWMGIEAPVGSPPREHPKRVVEGFECGRSEVSGSRLWGWARDRFETPERFFERFFVYNYCPLLLLEDSGRNRTPPKLKKGEREQVLPPCDNALRGMVDYFEPRFVIGVGSWAERRIKAALKKHDHSATVGRILHPSPASPKANRGWAPQAEAELQKLGVSLD